ncbi:Fanconi anemia core complex-associated protein 20 [Sciurus carolinensis]|uniref:Fanconi anemia core complex-associated protein 20 n=1 Tax=Sciurus carolinensis TaxID=30640 RepID=A0AA41T2R9_SCICA|nr:Fanconi anemia core complex-associated protein 20 isoform X2 [Sciurus carolinensis]MBZ3882451.1 Fanconi anemia core complex-associated protein 20 [Sciurus carolinensis]
MEAARRPPWRLSRRRPRSGDGPPSGCPWYLLAGSESQPWALLLRIANSDQAPDGEPLPPLPTFPSQEPGPEAEHILPPETFTVGPKAFSWTPLPPALGGLGCFYQDGCHQGSPTGSLKGHPEPDPCGAPSTKEQLSVEGPPALQNCPMCQKEFSPRLTQLDVDSHLAQCLAESTDDVAW